MDDVFKALADPSRRQLLDRLRERDGQNLGELCDCLAMARQSVSKHLAVLEAASLVVITWRGREKVHHLNAAPIRAIAHRWISKYAQERVNALADLKTALESNVSNTQFVYTTYVRTTPERLWQALTDPAFTRRYWGVQLLSEWRKGSPVTWEENGVVIADPEQVVLESDPPRRLAYTWHTFTPQWAAGAGIDDETLARLAGEPRSKVTFDVEPDGDQVRLTVAHSDFLPGSTVLEMVSTGWPRLLSDLKSLLEADEARSRHGG